MRAHQLQGAAHGSRTEGQTRPGHRVVEWHRPEIARALAAEGAQVVINGRSAASVEAGVASIRASHPQADLLPLVADNGTAEGCAATLAALPEVDILVNNLGIYEAVGFFDESDADWQRLFEVNILSGVRLARHYLAGMLARGDGRVVFISSESGISPAPEMAHYSATKTMQLGLSRSLAELTMGTRVTRTRYCRVPRAPKASRSSSMTCFPICHRPRPSAASWRRTAPRR